jgi:hypothetical protein
VPAALTVAAHTYTVTVLSRREVSGGDPLLPRMTLAGTAVVAASAAGRRPRWATAAGPAGCPPVTGDGAVTGGRAGAGGERASSVAAAALATWYAVRNGAAQARAAADPSPGRVRAAVGAGITGLPPLQGALAARAGSPAAGFAVAAAAPLAGRLARVVSPT